MASSQKRPYPLPGRNVYNDFNNAINQINKCIDEVENMYGKLWIPAQSPLNDTINRLVRISSTSQQLDGNGNAREVELRIMEREQPGRDERRDQGLQNRGAEKASSQKRPRAIPGLKVYDDFDDAIEKINKCIDEVEKVHGKNWAPVQGSMLTRTIARLCLIKNSKQVALRNSRVQIEQLRREDRRDEGLQNRGANALGPRLNRDEIRRNLIDKVVAKMNSMRIKNRFEWMGPVCQPAIFFVTLRKESLVKITNEYSKLVFYVHRKKVDITLTMGMSIEKRSIHFRELDNSFVGWHADLLPLRLHLFRKLVTIFRPKCQEIHVAPSVVGDPSQIASIEGEEIQKLLIEYDKAIITIEEVNLYISHFGPIRYLVIQNMKKTQKENCELSKLKNSNYRYLEVTQMQITNEEIIGFLKNWQCINWHCPSEFVSFTVSVNETHFDAETIYRALGTLPYNPVRRGATWARKNEIDGKVEQFECSDARDIFRDDGLLASVQVTVNSVFFHTWDERFPEKQDWFKNRDE